MARTEEKNRAVVTPLLGAGALGSGAYGSYRLNNYLDSLGLRKGLTINKDALKAIDEFASLTPESMRDPSRYLFRYADLGNKASKAQLFNEDPRKAYEWFTDSHNLRKGLSRDARRLERAIDNFRGRLADVSDKYLPRILGKERADKLTRFLVDTKLRDLQGSISGLRRTFAPISSKLNMKRTPGSRFHELMAAAHETEIGKSKPRALIRLMNEWADVSRGTTARNLASNTAEALKNWKNYLHPSTGKPFRSASDFLGYLYAMEEKSVRPYLRFFKDLDVSDTGPSKKELTREIKKRLFPSTFINDADLDTIKLKGRRPFEKEIMKHLGRTTKYDFNADLNKLVQSGKYRRRPGIKGVESIRSIIRKSPALTFIASHLRYSGKEFGTMAKALRVAQTLRNPKLTAALGLGAAGLGGLGITNIVKNLSNRKQDSLWEKIKSKIS